VENGEAFSTRIEQAIQVVEMLRDFHPTKKGSGVMNIRT
jgi:hypothetical protein